MNKDARQIESLDFNYLSQAATYQYSTEQLARVKASSAIMAKLPDEIAAWDGATQAFDTAFRKASTAEQTKLVESLDTERDTIYTGFNGTVTNALKSPIAAQRQAAQEVIEPIKRYAISTTSEYQEQTMRTNQLCEDLLTNFASQLTTLGLTAWVQALQAKNQEFQAAMTQRTNEQAGYIKNELTNLRQQIITTYRVFVKLMNVVLIYEGDTAYASVIDQMNAEVRHYRQIIDRKSGKTSGGGTSPDNPNTPNNPNNPNTPNTPDNPETPDNPDNPTNPDNPVNPGGGTSGGDTGGDDEPFDDGD